MYQKSSWTVKQTMKFGALMTGLSQVNSLVCLLHLAAKNYCTLCDWQEPCQTLNINFFLGDLKPNGETFLNYFKLNEKLITKYYNIWIQIMMLSCLILWHNEGWIILLYMIPASNKYF